ncbi:MAG: tetratricopeptide repeat protein [bacterium]|nr:tetratricopeptide repeat protein [bacterium]
MTIVKKSMIAAFIFCAFFTLITAQRTIGKERLKGTIVDKNNKRIESAWVILRYKGYYQRQSGGLQPRFIPATGKAASFTMERTSNKKGKWNFIGVGVGQWEITAGYQNLRTMVHSVRVLAGKSPDLITIKLEPLPPQEPGASPPATTGTANEAKDKKDKKTKDPVKLLDLGERLLAEDFTKKAIICFKLAAKYKPDWGMPYLRLGYAYFNMGKIKPAIAYFKKYLELDPKSEDAETVRDIIESLKEE